MGIYSTFTGFSDGKPLMDKGGQIGHRSATAFKRHAELASLGIMGV
jgi:hypothetical protein